ncbi:hypothetical protein [Caldiplasma sukawensis]
MNGSIYERELVSILSGNKNSIKKISKNLDILEADNYRSIENKPFFVSRSAGSKGADIIAVRYDLSFIIEVKSSSDDVLTFSSSSGRNQKQAGKLIDLCEKAGIMLIYAFRLKKYDGDPWRVFRLPGNPKGRMRIVYNFLPEVYKSKNGNFIIKFNDGMKLNEFLSFINKD